MHLKNMTRGLMGRITLIAAELIVGILLIVNPEMFIQAVVVGVGVLLIALGVSACIRYFFARPEDAMLEQSLAKGLIFILIGFILALKSTDIITVLKGLYTLFGIALVITGLMKIQWTVDYIRMRNNRRWYVTGISALISVIFGILVIFKPGAINDAIGIVTGVFLIVQSVIDITAMIFSFIRDDNNNGFRGKKPDGKNLPVTADFVDKSEETDKTPEADSKNEEK